MLDGIYRTNQGTVANDDGRSDDIPDDSHIELRSRRSWLKTLRTNSLTLLMSNLYAAEITYPVNVPRSTSRVLEVTESARSVLRPILSYRGGRADKQAPTCCSVYTTLSLSLSSF